MSGMAGEKALKLGIILPLSYLVLFKEVIFSWKPVIIHLIQLFDILYYWLQDPLLDPVHSSSHKKAIKSVSIINKKLNGSFDADIKILQISDIASNLKQHSDTGNIADLVPHVTFFKHLGYGYF